MYITCRLRDREQLESCKAPADLHDPEKPLQMPSTDGWISEFPKRLGPRIWSPSMKDYRWPQQEGLHQAFQSSIRGMFESGVVDMICAHGSEQAPQGAPELWEASPEHRAATAASIEEAGASKAPEAGGIRGAGGGAGLGGLCLRLQGAGSGAPMQDFQLCVFCEQNIM